MMDGGGLPAANSGLELACLAKGNPVYARYQNQAWLRNDVSDQSGLKLELLLLHEEKGGRGVAEDLDVPVKKVRTKKDASIFPRKR